MEFSQRLEGQEIKLELVLDQLTRPDGLIGSNNLQTVEVAAGVDHVGEVQPLVLRVEWRTGAPQPLTDGM